MHSVLKEALMTRQTAANQLTELYRRYERCFGDYFSIAECQAHCDTYYREYDEPDYNHAPPSNWQRGQRHGQQQQQQSGRKQPSGNKKQLTQLPTLAPKPKPPAAAAARSASATVSTAKTDAQKFADTKASNFKYSSEFSAPSLFCSLFSFCPHLCLHSQLGGKQDLHQELVSAMPKARAAQRIPGIWQHQRHTSGLQAVSGNRI